MPQQKNIPFSRGTLPGPVACVLESVAKQNIGNMVQKAQTANARLRPHFKTHQSHQIATWFRDAGISSCATSSPAMAEYFVKHGWKDVLIALPFQPGALENCQYLASKARIGITSDSADILTWLNGRISNPMDFWLEIDAGYGRTGSPWDSDTLISLAKQADTTTGLTFRGLLCHSGESYHCSSKQEIMEISIQAKTRITQAAEAMNHALGRTIEISYGDTPTCSVSNHLAFCDEFRPGNFVFYDVMQKNIGACDWNNIALLIACPIIGIYPDRSQLVIHGGAVHFSKEKSATDHYGQAVQLDDTGHCRPIEGAVISSLSQEHGIISIPPEYQDHYHIGDIIMVAPVHSCLAADCFRSTPSFHYIL